MITQSQYSRTSSVVALCVKSLFFDMYKRSLERLASALHELEMIKAAEISDRGHHFSDSDSIDGYWSIGFCAITTYTIFLAGYF